MPQAPQTKTVTFEGKSKVVPVDATADEIAEIFGLEKPKTTTNAPSVIWPPSIPNIPQIFKNLVIGAAKGTGNMAADLAKSSMNPGYIYAGIPTPFDVAKAAWQPEGMAQTIGSFAPDLALGYGTGLAAARTAAGTPGASTLAQRIERQAEKMWDKASNRPLAEISGNPGFSREVLEQNIGPMTQTNAVKQAELRASKVPGVIDTRTPAVPAVKPRARIDKQGYTYLSGGKEEKPATGFYAQLTKPRADAFSTTQSSYNQAKNTGSIELLGTKIPNPIPKGTTAQKLFNNADALQSAVPASGVGFAELLSRLFNSGGDQR